MFLIEIRTHLGMGKGENRDSFLGLPSIRTKNVGPEKIWGENRLRQVFGDSEGGGVGGIGTW